MDTTETVNTETTRNLIFTEAEVIYTPTFTPMKQTGEKHPQLHWNIELSTPGRKPFSIPYSEGIAHVKGYLPHKTHGRTMHDQEQEEKFRLTCETGKLYKYFSSRGFDFPIGTQPPPSIHDVFYCLCSDSDCMDDTFSGWASNLGYDSDSIKAQKIYQQCIEQTIQVKALFTCAQWERLREAYQDY